MEWDELAVSFVGRPELQPLAARLAAGDPVVDPRETVLVLLAESRTHERTGRLGEARATAQAAIDLARSEGDAVGVAGGLSHLAYAHYRMGEPDLAAQRAEQALDGAGPHAHTVTALLVLGLIATDACEWDAARERFLRARAWSSEIDYPLGVMLALHNLSVVNFHTGRFELAVAAASDVGRLNAEIRFPGWAYPWTRAIACQIIGDRHAAREALDELYAVEPPTAFATGLGKMLEAQLALDEEDVDEAERALVAARLEAERLGNPMVRAMVLLVTSRVRRARGDPASARAWIEEAIDETVRSRLVTLDGWMQLELIRVHWDLGDLVEAEQRLRALIDTADGRGAAHIAAEASVLLAVLASMRGDPDAEAVWIAAAGRMRTGGYGFLIERQRALVLPQVVALARSRDPESRRTGHEMLDMFARTSPVPLRVVGLGRFEVRQGLRVIPADRWRQRKAGELFRFLLTQPGHRAPRDVVVEALWPGQPPDSVQALLHQATSTLRRILEPELPDKFPSRYVRISGEMIGLRLPTGSVIDFDRFESLAAGLLHSPGSAPRELTAARDAYGGELFPDDRYADWSAGRRERLAELAAATGARLAETLLESGEARAALDASRWAIERDPLREDAVAVAMRASIVLGDRVGALRAYRRFEARIVHDLGAAPSAALRDIAADLGASGPFVDT